MTKISVIIPVYNTASYLKECIESVLNQSFRDIELICINDGSTDSSLEVLNYYKSKDNRVKIISQENKGVGAARNIGIDEATGEYVLFIDSDDYIKKDALTDLIYLAESKSLDVLMFKMINFDNNTYEESIYRYFEMPFLKNIVGDDVFNWRMIKNRLFDVSVTIPGKLFKRNLIKNIRFPENLIFEDNLFFIKVMLRAKRVYFHEEYLYYRRLRDDSITNSYFTRYSECIDIYDLIEKHIKYLKLYSDLSIPLFNRKCRDIFTRYNLIEDDEIKKDFYYKIRDNFSKNNRRYEREGIFNKCSKRSLTIFSNALNSHTHKEFELSVNLFDLEVSQDKLKLENDILKRKYENQIKTLNAEIEDYEFEIEGLINSPGFKFHDWLKNIKNRLM